MATLDMNGPWPLTNEGIDGAITRTAPGNYALGTSEADGLLKVSYVGRSDSDLNKRLKEHIGTHLQFKASYASSIKEAFEKECRNWHDFNPPENKLHPDRPEGKDWKCPCCKVFG